MFTPVKLLPLRRTSVLPETGPETGFMPEINGIRKPEVVEPEEELEEELDEEVVT